MANPGHVEGEGSAGDKFRVSGTQETVEGAGANEVSGVLSEASCCRCGAPLIKIIARTDVPWSAVWRGSRRSMDTNRRHRASRYALEAPRMAVAVSDELQEREGLGTNRALTALRGSSMSFGELRAKHRASGYALECCLEGFATLDGHKSMPSRERMCPGGP